MPSKTWSFNRGIAANFLKRFWPLWGAWLAVLLVLTVAGAQGIIASFGYDTVYNVWNAGAVLLNMAGQLAIGSAAVGVLAAMAMFHYLYQVRACGMMHTLPLRRESLFLTVWLTGLLPLLGAELLVMLIGMGMTLPGRCVLFVSWLQWFGILALGSAAFYGFAVFCAMLTGHWLVLPVVYAVLNFTAIVVEGTCRSLLTLFVYGMSPPSVLSLGFLSPIYQLAVNLSCTTVDVPTEIVNSTGAVGIYRVAEGYTLHGATWLLGYAVCGLVLSGCALLLYRRRQMETAGDVVAIPVLRPVFKYCLSLGTALVFAWLLLSIFLHQAHGGPGLTALVLLLLLIGAFIGYFAAEMLLQKTLKVFRVKAFRGFAVVCAALCLFVGLNEFDAFGYERRVPDADEVDYITVLDAKMDEPETVSALVDLHRAIIADKTRQERGYNRGTDRSIVSVMDVRLEYTLKNGRSLKRYYTVYTGENELADPDCLGWRLERTYNLPEFLLERVTPSEAITEQSVYHASLDVEQPMIDGVWQPSLTVGLTGEEAAALYAEGILPDAKAQHIGHRWYVDPDGSRAQAEQTNVTLDLSIRGDGRQELADRYAWLNIQVETASENTIRWLEENKGITVVPISELNGGEVNRSPIAARG